MIAPKPGSGDERLHAELVRLLKTAPEVRHRDLQRQSSWLAALGFSS